MAENHTKTNSIGLQLQVECWYEQYQRDFNCVLGTTIIKWHQMAATDGADGPAPQKAWHYSDRTTALRQHILGLDVEGRRSCTIRGQNCALRMAEKLALIPQVESGLCAPPEPFVRVQVNRTRQRMVQPKIKI